MFVLFILLAFSDNFIVFNISSYYLHDVHNN